MYRTSVWWVCIHVFLIYFHPPIIILLFPACLCLVGNREYLSCTLTSLAPISVQWKYLSFSFVLYTLDRVLRFYYSQSATAVVSASVEGGSRACAVTRLEMCQHGFSHQPGQYLFLNIPAISTTQWHPFSVSSCCNQATFTCHIKNMGDEQFTGQLYRMVSRNIPIKVNVDGPYGALSLRPDDYDVIILVAGGIGITPMISLAHHCLSSRKVRALCCGFHPPYQVLFFAAPLMTVASHPSAKNCTSSGPFATRRPSPCRVSKIFVLWYPATPEEQSWWICRFSKLENCLPPIPISMPALEMVSVMQTARSGPPSLDTELCLMDAPFSEVRRKITIPLIFAFSLVFLFF